MSWHSAPEEDSILPRVILSDFPSLAGTKVLPSLCRVHLSYIYCRSSSREFSGKKLVAVARIVPGKFCEIWKVNLRSHFFLVVTVEMITYYSRDLFDDYSLGLPDCSLEPLNSNDGVLIPTISLPRYMDPCYPSEDLQMSHPSFTEVPDMVMRKSSSLYFPVDMHFSIPEEDSLSSEVVDTIPSESVDPSPLEGVSVVSPMDPNPSEVTDTIQSPVVVPDQRQSTPSLKSVQHTTDSVESDDEWTLSVDSEGASGTSGVSGEFQMQSRNFPRHWTAGECDRLREGVRRWGSLKQWNQISTFVGTRNVSQCINKWKNDLSKEGKRQRWSQDATARLRQFLNEGLTMKEIQKRMPEYTYIQIYQQTSKLRTNTGPWEPWEYELLVKLKAAGGLSDTDIGRRLNNRHRDVVKNVWSHLKRERNL